MSDNKGLAEPIMRRIGVRGRSFRDHDPADTGPTEGLTGFMIAIATTHSNGAISGRL